MPKVSFRMRAPFGAIMRPAPCPSGASRGHRPGHRLPLARVSEPRSIPPLPNVMAALASARASANVWKHDEPEGPHDQNHASGIGLIDLNHVVVQCRHSDLLPVKRRPGILFRTFGAS
jgi:hypothetical protein